MEIYLPRIGVHRLAIALDPETRVLEDLLPSSAGAIFSQACSEAARVRLTATVITETVAWFHCSAKTLLCPFFPPCRYLFVPV